MKEQLYTIPVTDAFNESCECPLCAMKKNLEINAIDYTMGPSYMEDDVRAVTDELGFCNTHIKMLYENQNRLGLALMLNTHLKKTIKDIQKLQKNGGKVTSSLFKKKSMDSDIKAYVDQLNHSCAICDRINHTFERYLITVFHLYDREKDFRETFASSKGICTTHYSILHDMAPSRLSNATLNQFLEQLDSLYLTNMVRVQEDLEWFIDKFDYRNADAPWKNSQDALPRTITKTNSIL